MKTTNYLYQGKDRYEWLHPLIALRRAIADSFHGGHITVPMDSEEVRVMMHQADSVDTRDFRTQLHEFEQDSGFRVSVEDHDRIVRFSA